VVLDSWTDQPADSGVPGRPGRADRGGAVRR